MVTFLSTSKTRQEGEFLHARQSVRGRLQLTDSVYVAQTTTFKNGRPRPYSLALGRCVKQKLWERLHRPAFTEAVDEDGLVRVDVSYGVGVYPPIYDVDTSGEPPPRKPPKKELS